LSISLMGVASGIASRAIVIFAGAGGKTGLTPAEGQSQFGLTRGVPSAVSNGRD
jgi:hypothetical protein